MIILMGLPFELKFPSITDIFKNNLNSALKRIYSSELLSSSEHNWPYQVTWTIQNTKTWTFTMTYKFP